MSAALALLLLAALVTAAGAVVAATPTWGPPVRATTTTTAAAPPAPGAPAPTSSAVEQPDQALSGDEAGGGHPDAPAVDGGLGAAPKGSTRAACECAPRSTEAPAPLQAPD